MGRWKECKNCGNDNSEDMIYLCKDDNFVFCEQCGDFTPNLHGNNNCICPVCNSGSEVRILGEIDSGADSDDDKCENCGNVASGDMLYKCREDDLIFCEQCGDFTPNLHGNNNCICPICHSTSDVKVLDEIQNDKDDDVDDYNERVDIKNNNYEREEHSYENYKSSCDNSTSETEYDNYSIDNYDNYSNYQSNYNLSGKSFSKSWIVFVIIVFVIFFIYVIIQKPKVLNQQEYSNIVTISQPVSTRLLNPFGEGNGRVSFYETCNYCANVQVYYENTFVGVIPPAPLHLPPSCADAATLPVIIAFGKRTFTFKNENGETWYQTVKVKEGECVLAKAKKNSGIIVNVGEFLESNSDKKGTSKNNSMQKLKLSPTP